MGLLASRAGKPVTFQACGIECTAGRQTRKIWDEWTEWAKGILPDPLKVAHDHVQWLISKEQKVIADTTMTEDAKKEKIAALQAEQQKVTALALSEATGWLAFNSPRVQSLLVSVQGGSKMLYLQMREHHPGLDEDDAYEIFLDMGVQAAHDIFNMTSGKVPRSEKNALAPVA